MNKYSINNYLSRSIQHSVQTTALALTTPVDMAAWPVDFCLLNEYCQYVPVQNVHSWSCAGSSCCHGHYYADLQWTYAFPMYRL